MEKLSNAELITELRKHGLSNGGSLGWHSGLCDEAADRLEELTRPGRWIPCDYKPEIYCKCSLCGRRKEWLENMKHCPGCGHPMISE